MESSQEFVAQTAIVKHDHDHESADCSACVHSDDEFEELLGSPHRLKDFAEEKKAEDIDDQLTGAGGNNSVVLELKHNFFCENHKKAHNSRYKRFQLNPRCLCHGQVSKVLAQPVGMPR